MERMIGSWLVLQCHLNHCVRLREDERDERKRDARERTPYLASSVRVRWNAPYGRWAGR